jgi:hypothetical protein
MSTKHHRRPRIADALEQLDRAQLAKSVERRSALEQQVKRPRTDLKQMGTR